MSPSRAGISLSRSIVSSLHAPRICRSVFTGALTTLISITDPPRTSKSRVHDRVITPIDIHHALVVDLHGANRIVYQSTDIVPQFHRRLRDIVLRDSVTDSPTPKIDSVLVKGINGLETPSQTTWDVLGGLNPRHMEIQCHWDEDSCDLNPLVNVMRKSWSQLETLTLSGVHAGVMPPGVLRGVRALTLQYCGVEVLSPSFDSDSDSGAEREISRVRDVTIVEHHAVTAFVDLWSTMIITDAIERLKIVSTDSDDFNFDGNSEPFMEALRRCSSLTTLDLELGEFPMRNASGEYDWCDISGFDRLPRCFPSSVRHLRFRGPSRMVADMPAWLVCAKDARWLPHLESISFDLNCMPGERVVEKIFNALMSKRRGLRSIPMDARMESGAEFGELD